MKITTLTNSTRVQPRQNRAFTLIEMIGVLAIIAILAALLIPKVFNAINEARISNASVSIDTVKTAITDHYGKYGSLATSNTTPIASSAFTSGIYPSFDTVLLGEGLLDKPFAVKIGTTASVQLSNAGGNGGTGGYNLGGGTMTGNGNQAYTAEVQINGVAAQDALDLKSQIDGVQTNAITVAETIGRVEYAAPAGTPATATVYVYLTGR